MAALSRTQQGRLAEEVRSGNHRAFERLFGDCRLRLRGYILSWPGMDEAKAAEVEQDVSTKAWAKLAVPVRSGGFDSTRASFLTWVKRYIARPAVLRALSPAGSGVPGKLVRIGAEEAALGSELPDGRARPPHELLIASADDRIRSGAYDWLFLCTFRCGGYPHQQLAFAFSKLVYGSSSHRAIEGSPERVDRMHGDTRLAALLEEFWLAYKRESHVFDAEILCRWKGYLKPVRRRLAMTVGDLMRYYPATARQGLAPIRGARVGETCLSDYCASDQARRSAAISDWCDKVEKRVRRVLRIDPGVPGDELPDLLGRRACRERFEPDCGTRCKLRHACPWGKRRLGRSPT